MKRLNMEDDTLKLKILDKKEEDFKDKKSICYLCAGVLKDFVEKIPERYMDYDIQRGLTTNVYLDKLIDTVLNKGYIPPIVLVAEVKANPNPVIGEEIEFRELKVLDGLQRTFRLKVIWDTINLSKDIIENGNLEELYNSSAFKISRQYGENLRKIESNARIFKKIINFYKNDGENFTDIEKCFSENKQWFEVWASLEKKGQIDKMLVLNAGHKPVSIKHQMELLFLNIIKDDILKKFIRTKDISSSSFYTKRQIGQNHLSHFIIAILSFHEGKPKTVDTSYLQELEERVYNENKEKELEALKIYFDDEPILLFMEFLASLDEILNTKYGDLGIKWLGRETILAGMFGAIGYYYKNYYIREHERGNLGNYLKELKKYFNENPNFFNLFDFDSEKGNIDFKSVNIGNAFKYSTFNAICFALKGKNFTPINWKSLFINGAKIECK